MPATNRLVGQTTTVGPFFSGDTAPALEFVFLWDGGGYVNLTGGSVNVIIRRWDIRRTQPIGAVVTSGSAVIVDNETGRANFSWNDASPVSTVPVDTGWYMGQAEVTFADSTFQHTQRFIFEVLSPN